MPPEPSLNEPKDAPRSSGPRAVLFLAIVAVIALVGVPDKPMTPAEAADERELFDARFTIEELRAATELYRRDHGTWPGSTPGAGPPGALQVPAGEFWLERQLTLASDAQGAVVPRSEPTYPYGPYLPEGMPTNPINERSDVRVLGPGESMPASADDTCGWLYSQATGEWRANSVGTSGSGVLWFEL